MTTKQAARVPYGPHGCAQGRKGSQACRTGERERHGSLVALRTSGQPRRQGAHEGICASDVGGLPLRLASMQVYSDR